MEKKKSSRDRILETAERLFIEQGVENTTVREIAREAGTNLALLNYYFKSKENLFDEIFNNLLEKYTPSLPIILNAELPLNKKIEDYVSKYVDLLINNPKLVTLILSVLRHSPEKMANLEPTNNLYVSESFEEQLLQEAENGTIVPTHPEHFFINMISMIAFPFTIKHLIMLKNELDEKGFTDFMQDHKKSVSNTLIASLSPSAASQ